MGSARPASQGPEKPREADNTTYAEPTHLRRHRHTYADTAGAFGGVLVLRRHMSTYRAFQVTGSRNFELVTRDVTAPPVGQVRIRVETCGVCHSDVLAAEGLRADPSQPIVPGHEIVGVIEAVGDGVTAWHVGDRVGVGYLAGHCGECDSCRRGDFVNCVNQEQTGTTIDGGYAEVVTARTASAVGPPVLENDAGSNTSEVAARSASVATPPSIASAAGSVNVYDRPSVKTTPIEPERPERRARPAGSGPA